MKTIDYKGEAMACVYPAHAPAPYAVYKRTQTIQGKWFIYRMADEEIISCCQYRKAAMRACDELNELYYSITI